MANKIYDMGRIVMVICPECNFHCKNCSLRDFNNSTNFAPRMTIQEIKYILDTLQQEGLQPNKLTLHGGEPTLHPQFKEIVKLCLSYHYPKLEVVSNATLLTMENIETLKKVTNVEFSIYPFSRNIYKKLKNSSLLKDLEKHTAVNFRQVNRFFPYKQKAKISNVQENFNRCEMKNRCRVITTKGLYRCWVLYMLDQDCCPLERNKAITCLNRTTPYKQCAHCTHWEGYTVRCRSTKPESDKKVVEKAIEYIGSAL